MKHTEHAYHEAGYQYERLSLPASRIKRAKELRAMIASEEQQDRDHARRLIDQGRKEYQGNAKR
jgi:hypothetical protein